MENRKKISDIIVCWSQRKLNNVTLISLHIKIFICKDSQHKTVHYTAPHDIFQCVYLYLKACNYFTTFFTQVTAASAGRLTSGPSALPLPTPALTPRQLTAAPRQPRALQVRQDTALGRPRVVKLAVWSLNGIQIKKKLLLTKNTNKFVTVPIICMSIIIDFCIPPDSVMIG